MKKLFSPKPKIPKTQSQPNAIPTPVADQFARAVPARGPSDDHWVVVQDQAPTAPPHFFQDRSRSASLASLPPGVATYSTTPGGNINNTTPYQHPAHVNPYGGTAHQSSQSLLQPNHNQPLKKKQPHGVHGATAILRALDPEQASLGRSTSPSLENMAHEPSLESLPLSVETERDRDPRLAEREREYEAERERERQWERERARDRHRDQEHQKDRGREHQRERDQDRGRDRDKDRDRPKDKEKKKGLFSSARDKDKEKERGQAELTRMIGYLTATASEDWSLVLEVCERASASDSAARDATKALRREFKYAEPGAQLSAARLWAIMLRNCSDVFITQASAKKFLDTLEEVLLSGSTSPVVRERLLDVLAAAAFTHPGHGKEGYRALWKKVKPPNKPDEGIPFDEDDAMLNPSPVPGPNQFHGRNTPHAQSMRQRVISADEDMRRLFEECELGRGNAALLNQALTFARPEELSGTVIGEWYRKCRGSQDFIMAQIPWATAQADRSREELRRIYVDENGQQTRPIPTSKEEELLAALLGANQELLEAFRIYDDLERLGLAEQEEREVEERSRKETKLDRTQIQFIAADGSFQMEEPGGSNPAGAGGSAGPSRSPSPSPTPSFSNLPPIPTHRPASNTHTHTSSPHSGLAPPPPAPQGPRQARARSRTPSPDTPALPPALVPQHGHSGSLGVDIKRLARMSFESVQDLVDRASDFGGEQTPVVPSAKAMGKRRIVVEGGDVGSDDTPHSNDELDGRISPFGADESIENDEEENPDAPGQRWKKPVTFAYDAAAERAKEMRRDLGIPAPVTNGRAR